MRHRFAGTMGALLFALCIAPAPATAQVSLGDTLDRFGALAGTAVSNTGATTVVRNVGVSPGSSVTGFPPGVVVGGTIHAGDATAAGAQAQLTTAYDAAAGTPCDVDLTGQDLGNLTLTPGVYCFTGGAQLTGALALDFQGNPDAFFLFQVGGSLATAPGSSVVLSNAEGESCAPNLFWRVGSSATVGSGASFGGSILAQNSVTLTTGASVDGRALARVGNIILDTSTITPCSRAADLSVTGTDSPDPVAPGQNVTYDVTATNDGPDPARG
ncbi:MAG TPA: ice-binding family protein, partial [Acidimicrobiales bacterium]